MWKKILLLFFIFCCQTYCQAALECGQQECQSESECKSIGDEWPYGPAHPCINYTCKANGNAASKSLSFGCMDSKTSKCYPEGAIIPSPPCNHLVCSVNREGNSASYGFRQADPKCVNGDECVTPGTPYESKTKPCFFYKCEEKDGFARGKLERVECKGHGSAGCLKSGETQKKDCITWTCSANLATQSSVLSPTVIKCDSNDGKCRAVGDVWPTTVPCLNYKCTLHPEHLEKEIVGGCAVDGKCVMDGKNFTEDCNDMQCRLEKSGRTVHARKAILKDNKQYDDNGVCRDQNVPWTELPNDQPDICIVKEYKIEESVHRIYTSYRCRSASGNCYKPGETWTDLATCEEFICGVKMENGLPKSAAVFKGKGCLTSSNECKAAKSTGFSHDGEDNCRCDIVDKDNYVIICGELPPAV